MDLNCYPQSGDSQVRLVSVRTGARRLAVSLAGDFVSRDKLPVVCLAGYHRNMEDFSAFKAKFGDFAAQNWPIVRIDLLGRGHAGFAPRLGNYSTLDDAADVIDLCRVLGIHKAVFFGQGHGGNVIMAMGRRAQGLIGGAILCDAGAIINSKGLVRLRNNLKSVAGIRKKEEAKIALRQIYADDYPTLGAVALDAIGARCHEWSDRKRKLVPRFDWRLVNRLDKISNDDVMKANWDLFDSLQQIPLLLMRTQNTDLLRDDVYQRMLNRRPDADSVTVNLEGSPALLEHADEMASVARFVLQSCHQDR